MNIGGEAELEYALQRPHLGRRIGDIWPSNFCQWNTPSRNMYV